MSSKKVVFTNDELKLGSHYLRYHLKMYTETLLELQDNSSAISWDTVGNAVLEDHLVHARALIDFLSKDYSKSREDDILAVAFFLDVPSLFTPFQDKFLIDQAQDIGGQAIHITKKSMPNLRSQKDWPIREIAKRLAPALKSFFTIAPEAKLADNVKRDCLGYLARLTPPEIPVSFHVAT